MLETTSLHPAVPVGLVGFVLLLFNLKIHAPKMPLREGVGSIDFAGILLIIGGIVMLLLGLQLGGVTFPWSSPTVICLLIFGPLVFALFVLAEWNLGRNGRDRSRRPVIPLRIFTHRSNVVTLMACFFHGMILVGPFFFLPLYFQSVLGATPILSGVWLFLFFLFTTMSAFVAGGVTKATGRVFELMVLGMALSMIGFGLLSTYGSSRDWAKIIVFQIILGMGLGPNTFTPIVAIQRMIDTRDIAAATSTLGFARQLGSSCSAVIGGAVVQSRVNSFLPAIGSRFGSGIPDELDGSNVFASPGIVAALPTEARSAVQGAIADSMMNVWYFYCGISALGFLFALFVGNILHSILTLGDISLLTWRH